MSVRMKLTHSKTGSRRSHHNKETPRLVATKTGVRRRHFVDLDTGMYRGKQILATETKTVEVSKKTTKKPAKAEKKATSVKEDAGK